MRTPEEKGALCTGHHYVHRGSAYKGTQGRIVHKVVFRELRRMSCSGCLECQGLLEMLDAELSGGMIPYPDHLEDGEVVTLEAINDGRNFEELYDEYHLEFVRKT